MPQPSESACRESPVITVTLRRWTCCNPGI